MDLISVWFKNKDLVVNKKFIVKKNLFKVKDLAEFKDDNKVRN